MLRSVTQDKGYGQVSYSFSLFILGFKEDMLLPGPQLTLFSQYDVARSVKIGAAVSGSYFLDTGFRSSLKSNWNYYSAA
jgi:hypothetical protein